MVLLLFLCRYNSLKYFRPRDISSSLVILHVLKHHNCVIEKGQGVYVCNMDYCTSKLEVCTKPHLCGYSEVSLSDGSIG